MAREAAEAESKTMKAWPLALRLVFATRSMMVPYSEKISVREDLRASSLMRSSRLRT